MRKQDQEENSVIVKCKWFKFDEISRYNTSICVENLKTCTYDVYWNFIENHGFPIVYTEIR